MLVSLALSRWKGFYEVSAPLGACTVVMGENATGKSNLGDALRFLHALGRGLTLGAALDGEDSVAAGRWNGLRGGRASVAWGDQDRIGIVAELQLGPAGRQRRLTWRLSVDLGEGAPTLAAESLTSEEQLLYTVSGSELLNRLAPGVLRAFVRAEGGESEDLLVLDHSPVLTQLANLLPHRHDAKQAASEVIAWLKRMRFLELSPAVLRLPALPETEYLGDQGEGVAALLHRLSQDPTWVRDLSSWLQALAPSVGVVETRLEHGRVWLCLREPHIVIPASNASDGTLRLLGLLAAVFGSDISLLFLDEVDTGLHPTRQQLLLRLLSAGLQEGSVQQVVCTTHNPATLVGLDAQQRGNALLAIRLAGTRGGRLIPLFKLPDFERVIANLDLGQLAIGGWLEDAASFMELEDERSEGDGGGDT
jgi:predicted ATPase